MNDDAQTPERKRFLDEPRIVKRLLWVFYAVCAGLLALDFVHHRHVIHEWENLPGFYGVYGFIACVVLVLVAKEMRKLVMRDEDHYDER